MTKEYLKELAIARLRTIPPNVGFSIGGYGDFSRDALIREIEKESGVGKAAIELEIQFIREMPRMAARVAGNE